METDMPVSCLAYVGESASYVPKSRKCNHLVLLVIRNRFQMKINYVPKSRLDFKDLGAKWALSGFQITIFG